MIQQQNQHDDQNIILTKNLDRYDKNRLVVNVDEFDIDKVIIKDKYVVSKDSYRYYIYYTYNALNGISGSKTDVIGTLRLYYENLKLRNDRPYITYYKDTSQKRHVKLPVDHNSNNVNDIDNINDIDDINDINKFNQIILSIKTKILQYINDKYDKNNKNNMNYMNNTIDDDTFTIKNSNEQSIYMLVNPDGKFESRIIRLGSKFSDHHNVSITKLKDFENMIRDSRFNDKKNDFHYMCNTTLFFTIFVVKKEDKNNVYFRTCVDTMEVFHNKSKYIPFFNPCDKIIVLNNTLVL